MTALLYHRPHTLTRSLLYGNRPTLYQLIGGGKALIFSTLRKPFLFLLFFTILLPALFTSCEQEQPCFDELRQYHAESLMLPTVSSDSITRFSDKVDAFVARHPAAEADPLYPQIQANIRQARLAVTIDVSPAWDDDIRINF